MEAREFFRGRRLTWMTATGHLADEAIPCLQDLLVHKRRPVTRKTLPTAPERMLHQIMQSRWTHCSQQSNQRQGKVTDIVTQRYGLNHLYWLIIKGMLHPSNSCSLLPCSSLSLIWFGKWAHSNLNHTVGSLHDQLCLRMLFRQKRPRWGEQWHFIVWS